jgi:hypothetical protein
MRQASLELPQKTMQSLNEVDGFSWCRRLWYDHSSIRSHLTSDHRNEAQASNHPHRCPSSPLFTALESNVEHSYLTVSENHRPMLNDGAECIQ